MTKVWNRDAEIHAGYKNNRTASAVDIKNRIKTKHIVQENKNVQKNFLVAKTVKRIQFS